MHRVIISWKKVVLFLLVVSAIILVAGCSTTKNDDIADQDQGNTLNNTGARENNRSLKIGVISTNTGDFAGLSDDIVTGVMKKISLINDQGGIFGNEIIVEERTGICSAQFGEIAARTLIELKNVDGIIGAGCEEVIKEAIKVALKNKVVLVDVGLGDPELAKQGPYIFNYRSNSGQSDAIINLLNNTNDQSVGIIYAGNDLSYSFAEDIIDEFTGEILFLEKYTTDNNGLQRLRDSIIPFINRFDSVVIVPESVDDLENLINTFNATSSRNPIRRNVMLANITIDGELIERLGPLIEDVRGAVPVDFIPNENSDYTQYLENYTPQVDASLVIFGADTVGMFTDAASKNGPNAKSIKEYLLSTTQSNPREEYNTMFSFNQSGNGTGITFKVVEIRNGEIVVLDQ